MRKVGATTRDADALEDRAQTVMLCLGISAPPPPFVIYGPTTDHNAEAQYWSGPPLIVLVNDIYFEHEVTHYLLEHTTGNADRSHDSRAWLCSPTD